MAAKFLTLFTQPKLWVGYPFSISVLVGDTLSSDLIVVIESYSSADVLLSTKLSSQSSNDNKEIRINVVNIYNASFDGVSYLKIYVKSTLEEVLTETLRINVLEPCDNAVCLYWRNSLGGDSFWVFDFNQEIEHFDKDNMIRKKSLLFANHLSITEWIALHDIFSVLDSYPISIIEFTGATIATHKNEKQQLYIYNSDGSKIGITADFKKNKTMTKQNKHSFELLVDYPAKFSI